ncbi:MAG: TPM domain-containing protein [Spirochaetaceae bacterium]|nr:MAG: TPM domain-containing protein [Spirochaetaceae bacterium]
MTVKNLVLVLLCCTLPLAALEVPPLSAPVTDLAGLLSAEQAEQLNDLLLEYEAETSNQFAVLIIPSLSGENLESYSIEVAATWALGQADKDNGLLLLVALKERRLRIEVGYGLEGVLTDAFCGRVIDNTIVPYFKNEQYFEGISAGLLELIRQTGDEFSPDPALVPATREYSQQVGAYLFLILPFLMILVVSIFLGRNRAFSRLYKRQYESLKGEEIRSAGMEPRLYQVWKKRIKLQLKGRVAGLAMAGAIPILPSLAMIPITPVALLIPGLYLSALFIVPLIWRPKELPYNLSYKRIEDDYKKLRELMKEVSSEEERQEMLKLFLAGYVSIALMRMVIQKKGHFDRKYYMTSFRASSSSGGGSRSSFSGGGGSFGGGGASGGW